MKKGRIRRQRKNIYHKTRSYVMDQAGNPPQAAEQRK